jgi:hypothetical protein
MASTARTRAWSAGSRRSSAAKHSGSRSSRRRSAGSSEARRRRQRAARRQRRAQRLELGQALAAIDEAGVGDGVGGPGEQVGQAHGFAQAAGQDREGQGEGPAHLPEQVERGHQS